MKLSLQSIIGATWKIDAVPYCRCTSPFSSGLNSADFWTDTNSRKLTIVAFSFRFKRLSRSPARPSMMPRLLRYSTAVSDEPVQYRHLVPPLFYPIPRLPRPQSSLLCHSPRVVLQDRDRSFGDRRSFAHAELSLAVTLLHQLTIRAISPSHGYTRQQVRVPNLTRAARPIAAQSVRSCARRE